MAASDRSHLATSESPQISNHSPKDDRIVVRCSRAEKARWKREARRNKRTLSDWIRLQLG